LGVAESKFTSRRGRGEPSMFKLTGFMFLP